MTSAAAATTTTSTTGRVVDHPRGSRRPHPSDVAALAAPLERSPPAAGAEAAPEAGRMARLRLVLRGVAAVLFLGDLAS